MNRSVPREDQGGWWTRERLMTVALFILTLLIFYGCYLVTRPFLGTLTWSVALAIVVFPAHRWLTARVKRRSLAAGLSVLAIVVVIAAPAFLIGQQVARQIAKGVEQTRSQLTPENWKRLQNAYPRLGRILDRVEKEIDLRTALERVAGRVSGLALMAVKGSVNGVVQAAMVFFFLFFFLRDAHRVLPTIRAVLPLTPRESDTLFRALDDIVHAIMSGMLIVAIVQGTLGTLIFWALGLPAPILWGTVMGIFSFLPTLGTGLVWGPVACFLALGGDWMKAVILFGYGLLVIGLIDNFLYPTLVGKRIRLHIVAVLIAMVGGVTLFGFAGIILGPMLFAMGVAVLQIWHERTSGGETADRAVQGESTIVVP